MKFRHLALAAALVAASASVLAQDIRDRVVKFGHLVQPGHPIALGAEKFAELVASKSGGKMKVREYGASVLGSEAQQVSALQGGVQEMFAPATTSVGALKLVMVIGTLCRMQTSTSCARRSFDLCTIWFTA